MEAGRLRRQEVKHASTFLVIQYIQRETFPLIMRILGDIPLEMWVTNHVEKQENRKHPSSNHSRNHLTWSPISHHERTRIMFKSTPMALTPLAWKCRVSFTWQKCENLTDVFIRFWQHCLCGLLRLWNPSKY